MANISSKSHCYRHETKKNLKRPKSDPKETSLKHLEWHFLGTISISLEIFYVTTYMIKFARMKKMYILINLRLL